jgi:hypothetical protein
MSDGGNVPIRFNQPVLSLDSIIGLFTISKFPGKLLTYTVDVDVVTTGGVSDEHLTLEGVQINIVCGPESTKLLALDMLVRTKATWQTDYELYFESRFTSTNQLCPVVSNVLVLG